MTRAELLRRIAALEKIAPGPSLAFAHERVLHDLQVHQVELETQNRELREAQQLIEISRDRYADLFDFAPVGFVTLDEKGLIREINLTAAGLLGVERTRLVGTPFHLRVAREDLAEFRAHLRALTEPDQHTAAELRLVRKGRAAVPVLMQSMLGADAEPGTRLYRSTITDITARKQAEAERHKFLSLADNSSEFIGMCDADFNPFYVNAAGLRVLGFADLAAACRAKVQDFFFPEDQPFITEEFFPRVLREGRGEVEIRFRHFQTGAAIWMLYNVFNIRDAAGAPVGWATVSRDITERKRAEEAVRHSEALLRSITDHTGDIIAVKDREGRYLFMNPAGCRAGGSSPEEIIGRTDADFHPDRDQALRFMADDRRIMESAQPEIIEEQFTARGGEPCVLLTNKMPRLDAQGRVIGIILVARNITERKRTEEALRNRSQQQQAVAEFGRHALAGRDLAHLFRDAVALLPLVLGVEFGQVLELRRESGDLLLRAGTGWKKGSVGRVTVSGGGASQAGFTLLTDAPVVVADYAGSRASPCRDC